MKFGLTLLSILAGIFACLLLVSFAFSMEKADEIRMIEMERALLQCQGQLNESNYRLNLELLQKAAPDMQAKERRLLELQKPEGPKKEE